MDQRLVLKLLVKSKAFFMRSHFYLANTRQTHFKFGAHFIKIYPDIMEIN